MQGPGCGSCLCSLVRAVLWAWTAAIPALFPSESVSLSADSGKSSQAVQPGRRPELPRLGPQTLWCSPGRHVRYIARLPVS